LIISEKRRGRFLKSDFTKYMDHLKLTKLKYEFYTIGRKS